MNDIAAFVQASVLHGAGDFARDIHDQRATHGDIKHLVAAANGEQRFALAEDFIDQDQFAQIALAAVGGGVHRFAELGRDAVFVKPRFDVVTAGDEDAIRAANTFGNEFA